jgi:adenosylmethionine-8-amino-7-oxononanoate aminotransferase
MNDNSHLEEADRRYVWHPFTQMKDWEKERPVIIEEGRGSFIRDTYGRWYLDGVSSLWVNIHGHARKEIDDALLEQIGKISHSTMLGLSNVPAIRLAEKLLALIPRSAIGHQQSEGNSRESEPENPQASGLNPHSALTKVFYSDNGSTSVEVALKMAFQYWKQRGEDGRHAFLSLNNAYHGDTLGAVSVGGVDIFHNAFGPLLFRTYRAPSPYCYRCELGRDCRDCGLSCVGKMEDILKDHAGEIAAVIIEPLVQAAGGMIVAPAGYLKAVRDLCTKYRVLMIADEVATGFGRTGKMFACEHESVTPDILCLSKGITGGYLPLAATITTDEVYDAFLGEFSELKTFFHGHSYTGNPLACAAAIACLEIFEKEDTLNVLQPKIGILDERLREMSGLPHVGDARGRGLMAGVELVKDKKSKAPFPWEEKMGWKVALDAMDKGVFIRPLGNVVVIMPPLSISKEELTRLLDVIRDSITAVT